MKLTTQLTVVICAGIAGMVAMVVFLSYAGWSEGGIAGMVTGTLTAVGALVVVVRNQVKTSEQIDNVQRQINAGQQDQSGQLEVIARQTNGITSDERQDIAERAVKTAMAQMRDRGTV
jgi:uncharacterized transporter YbjL